MAYQYKGPSLAAGGKLVKKGQRPRKVQATSNKPKSIFTPEEWARRLAPGWDERGWHGGGTYPSCNTVYKRRASKGNTYEGKFAHPSLLRVTLCKRNGKKVVHVK